MNGWTCLLEVDEVREIDPAESRRRFDLLAQDRGCARAGEAGVDPPRQRDDEHRAHGIPFPPTRERFDRLEEQLAIITGMWTTPVGETFSYRGRYYELTDSPALPKPVQQPHPPIIIGGYGTKRTPALAARYAREFNLAFPPLDVYRESVHACFTRWTDSRYTSSGGNARLNSRAYRAASAGVRFVP